VTTTQTLSAAYLSIGIVYAFIFWVRIGGLSQSAPPMKDGSWVSLFWLIAKIVMIWPEALRRELLGRYRLRKLIEETQAQNKEIK
jgi:hypothetical protein